MAVTRNAYTDGGQTSGFPASKTVSHTIPAGSNQLVTCWVTGNNLSMTDPTATYNGTSMVKIAEHSGTGIGMIYLFALLAPDSGSAYDCVVTQGGTKAEYLGMHVVSYDGVNQLSEALHAITFIEGNANTASLSVRGLNNFENSFLAGFAFTQASSCSAGTGTTDVTTGTSNDKYFEGDPTTASQGIQTLVFVPSTTTVISGIWIGIVPDTFEQTAIEQCSDDDTAALWHMNGTAGSAAKKDNAEGTAALDLTEVNSPTATTGFDGEVNGGYQLTRSSSQAFTVSDNAALDFTGDLTIECWLSPDSTPSGTKYQILAKNSTASNESYQFSYRDSGGLILQFVSSTGGTGATEESWQVSANLGTGSYKYVVMVFDASVATAYFYVDGVLVGSDTNTNTSIFAGTSPLTIGGEGAAGTTNTWDGKIDEVKLTGRAKSAAEIAKYYFGTVSAKFNADSGTKRVYKEDSSNWATTHDAATGQGADTTLNVRCDKAASAGSNYHISRLFTMFNTASLPDSGISINAAFWYGLETDSNNLSLLDIDVVESTQASDTAVTTADYDAFNTTKLATTIDGDTIIVDVYNPIQLNSAGIAVINKSGYTNLCLREKNDYDDSAPTSTSAVYVTYANAASSTPPYLWVEYNAAAAGNTGDFFLLF